MNKIYDWVWNPLKKIYNIWSNTLSNKGKLVVSIVAGVIIILYFYL
tara:strand:- start:2841 stop:2978 length:138 start_codon:yes stop_codon:yes gene_type:complete